MIRLAISGHRGLPPAVSRAVDRALRAEVLARGSDRLVGVTCLADGPDSMFARHVLDSGGSLVVVVPARTYREGLPAEHHADCDELISKADEVIRLDRAESDAASHMAAACACSMPPIV